MKTTVAVGIDFGASSCRAAFLDAAGRPVLVADDEGERGFPSILYFDDETVLVGRLAQQARLADPRRAVLGVKRAIAAGDTTLDVLDTAIPLPLAAAFLFRRLKDGIVRSLGHADFACVVAAPFGFDPSRRAALLAACDLAGLPVLELIDEPTAAAQGLNESAFLAAARSAAEASHVTVLNFDLGGSALGVSIVRYNTDLAKAENPSAAGPAILAVDGELHLGGDDWDARLFDYVTAACRKRQRSEWLDQPAARARLRHAVVEATHTLTARTRTSIRVEGDEDGIDVALSREEVADLTADLVERAAYVVRQLMASAGVRPADIDRVLLLGGAARMPMIRQMLADVAGREGEFAPLADEVIARGAAQHARRQLARACETPAAATATAGAATAQETAAAASMAESPTATAPARAGPSDFHGTCRDDWEGPREDLTATAATVSPQTTEAAAAHSAWHAAELRPLVERLPGWEEIAAALAHVPIPLPRNDDLESEVAADGASRATPFPQLVGGTSVAQRLRSRSSPLTPHAVAWWIVGYLTSAAVGLGLGYLVLSWLRPAQFPWPF